MKRTLQEREGHCISGKCEQAASQLDSTITGMLLQPDGWLHGSRPHEVDVLCDESRIKKELGRQCASRVCLKTWKASGAGMEHRLATGQRFTTVGCTLIVMRTRDKISVWV